MTGPGKINVVLTPDDVTRLLETLWRIDRQGQHAFTGSTPVSADAIFRNVDTIRDLLAQADPTSTIATMITEFDSKLREEAMKKLL